MNNSPNSKRLLKLLEESKEIEPVTTLREAIDENANALLNLWLCGKKNIQELYKIFYDCGYCVDYTLFARRFKELRDARGIVGRRYDLVRDREKHLLNLPKSHKNTISKTSKKPPAKNKLQEDPDVINLRDQLLRPNATEVTLQKQKEKNQHAKKS